MKNALQKYRIEKGLSVPEIAAAAGYDRTMAWRHCQSSLIPAEAAIKYSQALGIPLEELRPDLFSQSSSAPPPGPDQPPDVAV